MLIGKGGKGGGGLTLLSKERKCFCLFFQLFLGYDGEFGELLVHRRIMNLP